MYLFLGVGFCDEWVFIVICIMVVYLKIMFNILICKMEIFDKYVCIFFFFILFVKVYFSIYVDLLV